MDPRYTHTALSAHTHTHTHTDTHTHSLAHTHTHTKTHMLACTHTHVRTHVHKRIHARPHARTLAHANSLTRSHANKNKTFEKTRAYRDANRQCTTAQRETSFGCFSTQSRVLVRNMTSFQALVPMSDAGVYLLPEGGRGGRGCWRGRCNV